MCVCVCVCMCMCVLRTFKIHFLSIFQVFNTDVNYGHHFVHYIPEAIHLLVTEYLYSLTSTSHSTLFLCIQPFRVHIKVRAYSIFLSLSDLFYSAQYIQGPFKLLQEVISFFIITEQYSIMYINNLYIKYIYIYIVTILCSFYCFVGFPYKGNIRLLIYLFI